MPREFPAPNIGESISVRESPDVAHARWATVAATAAECRSFEAELLDGRRAVVSVAEREAPPLGDESAALVITTDPEEGPGLTLDVMAVRLGSYIVLTDSAVVEGDPRRRPGTGTFRRPDQACGREGAAVARALLTGRPDGSSVTGGSSRVPLRAPGRGRP